MTRALRWIETQIAAEYLHRPERIAPGLKTTTPGSKQQGILLQLLHRDPSEERLPQFETAGHRSFTSPFTVKLQQKVIEIAVINPESKRLTDASTSIE
jgi:hypothetical protein